MSALHYTHRLIIFYTGIHILLFFLPKLCDGEFPQYISLTRVNQYKYLKDRSFILMTYPFLQEGHDKLKCVLYRLQMNSKAEVEQNSYPKVQFGST
jgi:hypothetical protein